MFNSQLRNGINKSGFQYMLVCKKLGPGSNILFIKLNIKFPFFQEGLARKKHKFQVTSHTRHILSLSSCPLTFDTAEVSRSLERAHERKKEKGKQLDHRIISACCGWSSSSLPCIAAVPHRNGADRCIPVALQTFSRTRPRAFPWEGRPTYPSPLYTGTSMDAAWLTGGMT